MTLLRELVRRVRWHLSLSRRRTDRDVAELLHLDAAHERAMRRGLVSMDAPPPTGSTAVGAPVDYDG